MPKKSNPIQLPNNVYLQLIQIYMDWNTLDVYDFSHTLRLRYNNIWSLIVELLLQIKNDDTFPTECCVDCVNKLHMFHEYAQQCINFQNRLLELSTLNNSEHADNIKIELDFQDLDHFKKESYDAEDGQQFVVCICNFVYFTISCYIKMACI